MMSDNNKIRHRSSSKTRAPSGSTGLTVTTIPPAASMKDDVVSMKPTFDHKFKLMMLGDAGVGKIGLVTPNFTTNLNKVFI